MSDDFVQVAPDGGGKRIDTVEVTTDAGLVERQRVTIDNIASQQGVWAYHAGMAGTVTCASGERVLGIAAHAAGSGGTVTINGGDAVPVPTGASIAIAPSGNLVAPVIVFTGTDSFFVEVVS